MAAWPAYAQVVADGYTVGRAADVQRTTLEDGARRQAKVYTAAPKLRTIEVLLADDADMRRFDAWAGTSAHAPFAWVDPEDGTARSVVVQGGHGGITYRAETTRSLTRYWIARMTLEGLESDTVPS